MRTASGVAAGTAVGAAATGGAGVAAAQEEEPEWPEFVEQAPNFESTDMRGEEEVTVAVGAGDGLQFDPAAIWVDPGTTVIWEWTGEGGQHNVMADPDESEGEAAPLEAPLQQEEGATYEFEFTDEHDGSITAYYCEPHLGQNMIGGVAVGEVPTREAAAGGEGAVDPHELGVQIREHYVGVGAIIMIMVSLIFTFFVLKYGESPHAKGGGR